MTQRGGQRPNAGRKTKAEEEKANETIINALKSIYKTDDTAEAKNKLIEDLLSSQRGTLFIAEHIFGKPKETIDGTIRLKNFNLKNAVSFDGD